jgi:hypothetical protein
MSGEPHAEHPRRKSRWGSKVDRLLVASEHPAKRSRWSTCSKPADPMQLVMQLGIPLAQLQLMSAEQVASLPLVKKRVDEIDAVLCLPTISVERRSPSPDPIFDRDGAVINSHDWGCRQVLENERAVLLDGLKPKVVQRQWRKLIVPVDKYPGHHTTPAKTTLTPTPRQDSSLFRQRRLLLLRIPRSSLPPPKQATTFSGR